MPELPGVGVLANVRKEIERNALRAKNGIKWAGGGEFAPVAPTPSDVIWEEGKVHVRHYRRSTPVTHGPPVLVFLGLVGKPYVFDLWDDNSIVRILMDAGLDVYVLDWGVADETDSQSTLEIYLGGYLPHGIEAVLHEAGADEVNLLTYCMGGCMALHALAARPDLPVSSLVTIASPVDFRHLGPLIDALREGRIEPHEVLDDTGNVPGSVVKQSFKSRKPTGDLVQYANLWQNLWNDDYMEGYQAIGRWLSDHIPVPGALFTQVTQQWIRGNGFVEDTLRLHHRKAPLAGVDIPVLAVVADRDDIAVPESTLPIAEILPRAEVMRVDAGHASLLSGRKAVKQVLPQIIEWIKTHSKELS